MKRDEMGKIRLLNVNVNKEEEEEEVEELEEEKFNIKVRMLTEHYVSLKTEYDEEFVTMIKRIPSRSWDSFNRENNFRLEDWEDFLERLNHLSFKTKFEFEDGAEEAINDYINRPHVVVSLEEKNLIIKTTCYAGQRLVRKIEGLKYSHKHARGIYNDAYKIQAAELWKVYEVLEGKEKVKWEDGALEFAEKELERRKQLDILLGEIEGNEIDVGVKLNGIELKPFQKQAVAFADFTDYNCIIAHQMGLGKTLMSIASCVKYQKEKNNKARFLVVIPGKLKSNWVRHIEHLTGERALVLYKSSPNEEDMLKVTLGSHVWTIINYEILGRKLEVKEDVKDPSGVVIGTTTKDRYLWVELLNMRPYDIIVLDEAHYIKNTRAQRSKATRDIQGERFIPMTGTPILNRPSELWPLLNLVRPDQFPSFDGFVNTYSHYDGTTANVERLKQTLRTTMIRKTKKEVMKDLPPINRIYEYRTLSSEAMKVYKGVLNGVYAALEEWTPNSEQKAVTGILAQINRLKQVCAYDKIETVGELARDVKESEDNGGKVIIFSFYVDVIEKIKQFLGDEAIELHGSKKDQWRIDKFRNDPNINYLVAQYQVGGEGHDLQCANNVIFADLFWTPAAHQQCEERAYGRMADPHPINSYYVIVEESIEIWIQELLDKKLKVIEQVVEGTTIDPSESIAKDLLRRMKEQMRR